MDLQINSYFLLYVTKCTKVASCTFAVLEIASTLPEEVNFVWPTKMNAMKAVFLINKYSPLADTTLGIIFVCDPISSTSIHTDGKDNGFMGLQQICRNTPSCTQDQDAWPAYLCMILAETGIVVLTLLKQYMNPVGEGASKSVLFETMYRDGLFFYAIVLSISVVNVLVMLFAPPELSPAMQMPLRVIHSALCTRVLLNLRKAASASPDATLNDTFSKHTTIAFHHSTSEHVDSDDE
ncbi:hypothetical protein C8Q74DRAFT_1431025 [Fomes fomentarius]|nr:hypothetical protein C8Q74DRAFT_1431025 [Fomes fomentarius]